MSLTENQKLALSNATKKAKLHQKNVSYYLERKFIDNNIDVSYIDKIINYINQVSISTRIRYVCGIFNSLIKEPKIKNKYELSNINIITSDPYRYEIENMLFNNAYKSCESFERVKYGSLNITNKLGGDASTLMYGEINLIYKDHVKNRCSFTYDDSFTKQQHICTFTYFKHILYHLEISDIHILIDLVNEQGKVDSKLKKYIELQIHGDINLNEDIDTIEIPYNIYSTNKDVISELIKIIPSVNIVVY